MSTDTRVEYIHKLSKEIFEIIQANELPDFFNDKEESYIIDYLKITKTNKDVAELASPSMLNKANFFRPYEEKYIIYDIYASEEYSIIVNPFLLKVIFDRMIQKYNNEEN